MSFVEFLGKPFSRTPPTNHFSHDVVFSFLQISEVCSLKSIYLVEQRKLGEGIHKPVQSGVVMEIRWKLHRQVVVTHVPT